MTEIVFLRIVCKVEIVRLRRIFGSQRVDLLDKRKYSKSRSSDADFLFVDVFQSADLLVRESQPLGLEEQFAIPRPWRVGQPSLRFDDVAHSVEEPFIDR